MDFLEQQLSVLCCLEAATEVVVEEALIEVDVEVAEVAEELPDCRELLSTNTRRKLFMAF